MTTMVFAESAENERLARRPGCVEAKREQCVSHEQQPTTTTEEHAWFPPNNVRGALDEHLVVVVGGGDPHHDCDCCPRALFL